jgi:septum formation protein
MLHCVDGQILGEAEHVSSTSVTFAADLDDQEIDAYIATAEPLSVAGAFTIDGRAAGFIESISGDPYTVVGVSVSTVRSLVRQLGFSFTDLWK